jgi:uncharacterized GH25 family protein
MRRHKAALLALGLMAAGSAAAHDLWLNPATFWLPAGGAVPVSILVGHGKDRQSWGVRSDKILRLGAIEPGGRQTDFTRAIAANSAIRAIPLRLAHAGTHLLMMESRHSQSDLPAQRFEEYLREEGLTPAIAHRQRAGASGRPGREIYSRRAKSLVHVGKAGAGAPSPATRRLGLTLEIVPERDPYTLPASAKLPLRVWYQGKPLAGALVKLTDLDADVKPLAAQLTDASGRVWVRPRRPGKWLLNVVWTKPISGNSTADYDTTFSSLSFGYSG